jgi:DNA-binding HxlR family transcriptional regulator
VTSPETGASATFRDGADLCPIDTAAELIFSRWTSPVLRLLHDNGRMRFKDLRDRIPGITSKVLAGRLRKLERDGLVTRTYHREMPRRVEYEITVLAESLEPVFQMLAQWSERHVSTVATAQDDFDARNT